MSQLKNDITDLFSNPDKIKEIYPDYNGTEYEDILIKEAYEQYPELRYPNITIEEITNLPIDKFWDGREYATSLGYTFTINCKQSVNFTANQNVKIIQDIIDIYIQTSHYNCFRRIGRTHPKPFIDDNNVRTGFLRYDCALVASQNTIYRRY